MNKLKSYLKSRLQRLDYEKTQIDADDDDDKLMKLVDNHGRIQELNNLAANFNIKLNKL